MKRLLVYILLIGFLSLSNSPLIALEQNDYYYNDYNKPESESYTTYYSILKANTTVVLSLNEKVSTKTVSAGSIVRFNVETDVKDSEGNILIKAGTIATAEITTYKNKGMIGQSGSLGISNFRTTAVDGTQIPLLANLASNPDGNTASTVTLTVLFGPLGLLRHGKDAEFAAGTLLQAYTISDTKITLSNEKRTNNYQKKSVISNPEIKENAEYEVPKIKYQNIENKYPEKQIKTRQELNFNLKPVN